MYERSVIVLERYFSEKFLYKENSNLKNNYLNYCDLVEKVEKYQQVSDAEDKIIKECEEIISSIERIQKQQKSIYGKVLKLHEDRNTLFENIDESSDNIEKGLKKIEQNIDKNNEEMKSIDEEYINIIKLFNEKSKIRLQYGRSRRKVEKAYREILELTIDNYNKMNHEGLKKVKAYLSVESTEINSELKKKMLKNGENEKIPFDKNVIESAIILGEKIHREEASILLDIYHKTRNLLNEINIGEIKIGKHKKTTKNAKVKLDFINSQKEYLFLFLDNERLSVSLGKKEHKKLMEEACLDLEKDLIQINNLNELLLKEISGKATKKDYKELYNEEYFKDLKKKETDFDDEMRKLNLVGKIINPIYWRIDGIEKLYETFDNIATEEYGRDLSEFKKDDGILPISEKLENDSNGIDEEKLERMFSKQKKIKEDSEELLKETNKEDNTNRKNKNAQEKNYQKEKFDIEEDNYEDINSLLKKRKEKLKKEQAGKKQVKQKKNGILGKLISKK